MAANTSQAAAKGTVVSTGQHRSVITAAEANNLKTSPGKVAQVIVWNVGATATIDVYDDPSANSNQVWSWASADGKNTYALQIPMAFGIRVVSAGGTPPSFTVVWD